MRTRFAPSPTGDLHLGGAWTALASWVLARARGGRVVLRVEDLDPPRVVAGSAARVAEDLTWLGLDWDEGPDVGGPFAPYTQSERAARYAAAVDALDALGLVYPCDCSRKDIARAASAPHAGEELRYPGTCRDAPRGRAMKREPALRLRVPTDALVGFDGFIDSIIDVVDVRHGAVMGDYTRYKHGEAVCLGMLAAGHIAVSKGMWSEAEFGRQNALIARLGIAGGAADLDVNVLLERMASDKKARSGVIRFVLPERIGHTVSRDDVTRKEMVAGIRYMQERSGSEK